MIRVLLGSVLPVLGIGAVATLLSPDVLTGPRGEPLILAASGEASLQAATYTDGTCASNLLLADPSVGEPHAPPRSGPHIVVFAFPQGANDVAVAVEDYPQAPAPPKTVVLLFDGNGRLIGVGDPNSLDAQASAGLADCIEPHASGDVQSPV